MDMINNDIISTLQCHGETLNKTSASVEAIHTALMGTYDKKGLITTVKEHDEFICEAKKSRIDWIRWTERAVAAAGFAWIIGKIKGTH